MTDSAAAHNLPPEPAQPAQPAQPSLQPVPPAAPISVVAPPPTAPLPGPGSAPTPPIRVVRAVDPEAAATAAAAPVPVPVPVPEVVEEAPAQAPTNVEWDVKPAWATPATGEEENIRSLDEVPELPISSTFASILADNGVAVPPEDNGALTRTKAEEKAERKAEKAAEKRRIAEEKKAARAAKKQSKAQLTKAMPVIDQPEAEAETPSHSQPESAKNAVGAWYSPGTALVVASGALAWNLVSYYSRELLPNRVSAGAPLDRFDSIVGSMPLVAENSGTILGFVLVAMALTLVVIGVLRGFRHYLLQFAIALVALVGVVMPLFLAN